MSERIKCRNILSGYVMEVTQLGQTYLSVNCGPYRKSGEVYSAEDLDFCKEHLLGADPGDIVRISPSGEIYGFSYDRHPVKNIRVPLDQKCEGGTKRLDFKRICTGYAYKESETFLNFDYIRPHLARQIGEHLLKENMIQFSIDDKNRDMNIIRAEVLAARPLEDDFQ